MKCQRCSTLWDHQAVARIRTDILDLAVCGQCAKQADDLGLTTELLVAPATSDGSDRLGSAA